MARPSSRTVSSWALSRTCSSTIPPRATASLSKTCSPPRKCRCKRHRKSKTKSRPDRKPPAGALRSGRSVFIRFLAGASSAGRRSFISVGRFHHPPILIDRYALMVLEKLAQQLRRIKVEPARDLGHGYASAVAQIFDALQTVTCHQLA